MEKDNAERKEREQSVSSLKIAKIAHHWSTPSLTARCIYTHVVERATASREFTAAIVADAIAQAPVTDVAEIPKISSYCTAHSGNSFEKSVCIFFFLSID
jgi:hypothetical protein